MKHEEVIDARLEALLAGEPATVDPLDAELSSLITRINVLVPEAVIPEAVAEAHLASIVDAARSLETRPVVVPVAKKRPGWWERVSSASATPARKIAAVTFSVSAAFSGMAYAGVLPDPIQRRVADLAGVVGISIPDPDDNSQVADETDGSQNEVDPQNPATPAEPERPTPEDAAKPDKDKPGKPDKPDNKPEKPDKPGKPGNKPGKPGNKPVKPDNPGKPDKEKPERDRSILDEIDLDRIALPPSLGGAI